MQLLYIYASQFNAEDIAFVITSTASDANLHFKVHWQLRVDDLSFFNYLSPFCFLLTEFHYTFFISYIKSYHIIFIIIVFWLICDTPSGLLSFMPTLFFSTLMSLFLPSSSVSISYFILAVPMHECLGKHSRMSSPFLMPILNGNLLLSWNDMVKLSPVKNQL